MNSFKGRTLAVIGDFSLDERKYLFEKTRELKECFAKGDTAGLDRFRIDDRDFGVYEVFLEPSTRTKESFKNAAEFHGVKLSNLDTGSSSFNKSESYTDTFQTLIGYNNYIFIVRSKLEGVCRLLEDVGKKFAERNGINTIPAFINAGDGKHEHPTQELLDEFTFLEQNGWSSESIHVALTGDLFHGRTVHSKVNGLGIFTNVKADLIAPPELAMPDYYIRKMEANGYSVRTFGSIEEYLDQEEIADKWYFTRPQLERMGDDILKRQDELREKIVFQKRFMDKIPEGTVFYHPLPRHKKHPTIPTFLDDTPLNGWENQSINGKLIRIVLLALIAGKIGDDFSGESAGAEEVEAEFIEELHPKQRSEVKDYAEGVKPISSGVVIDHICRGETEEEIRKHIGRIIMVLKLFGKGGEWISSSRTETGVMKGIIFRPGMAEFSPSKMKQLAAIAPECTLNIIKDGRIGKKLKLHMPPKIYNFDNIGCKNEDCISHFDYDEGAPAEFMRISNDRFMCKYCEKPHSFKEIWK